ncbi:MAG: hypothetical protein GY810_16705, partial [Aureispira sp.]|nr:hypothetical protein [Aureispira sp.]
MEKVSISGSSEYQQELQLFKDSKLFKRLKEKYRVKPYYEKNKNLRITALTSSYLFNLFSIAIGFLFMYKLFSTSLGPVLAIVVSSAILSTIEAFKRLILPPIAQTYLQFGKVAYIRTFIALTLVSISAFLS